MGIITYDPAWHLAGCLIGVLAYLMLYALVIQTRKFNLKKISGERAGSLGCGLCWLWFGFIYVALFAFSFLLLFGAIAWLPEYSHTPEEIAYYDSIKALIWILFPVAMVALIALTAHIENRNAKKRNETLDPETRASLKFFLDWQKLEGAKKRLEYYKRRVAKNPSAYSPYMLEQYEDRVKIRGDRLRRKARAFGDIDFVSIPVMAPRLGGNVSRCESCGMEWRGECMAAICPFCSAPLQKGNGTTGEREQEEPVRERTRARCASCGKALDPRIEVLFCPFCGAPL